MGTRKHYDHFAKAVVRIRAVFHKLTFVVRSHRGTTNLNPGEIGNEKIPRRLGCSGCCRNGFGESSVTMFGILTVGLQHGTGSGAGAADKTAINSGGDVTSRLGFRGTEGLGGGLTAGFWLEAQINVDNGTGAQTITNNQASGLATSDLAGGQGLTFNRRATVSLAGKSLGEVRLGRDYRVESVNNAAVDPFTVQGAGGSQGPDQRGCVDWENGVRHKRYHWRCHLVQRGRLVRLRLCQIGGCDQSRQV